MDDIKNMIWIEDYTKEGKCSQCGNCCSGILPLSMADIKRIHKYMETHKLKEHRSGVAMMTGQVDGTCPFRDDVNKRCDIYDVRPAICRVFICNKSKENAVKDRNRLSSVNKTVYMRSEFFGNNELKIILKISVET